VAEAVVAHTRVGRRVLRGAVANALAVALLQMSWHDTDRERHVPEARALLAAAPDWPTLVEVSQAGPARSNT
jgi:hypothetical protein